MNATSLAQARVATVPCGSRWNGESEMVMVWEGAMLWGALAVSTAIGIGAQVQLWFTRRRLLAAHSALLAELGALRQHGERDRNTIDSELASFINLSREEHADLKGRFDKFKETVESDLEDMSADLDVIETSVAGCVRASRASPFSSLNLQFLNDGIDDVRARLAALELSAQKARMASRDDREDVKPLWLVQRDAPARASSQQTGAIAMPAESKKKAKAPEADVLESDAPAAEALAIYAPALRQVAAAVPPRPEAETPPLGRRATFADWLSPSDIVVNDEPVPAEDLEPLRWPGSLSRIAAF
jgi:hypothetical protein